MRQDTQWMVLWTFIIWCLGGWQSPYHHGIKNQHLFSISVWVGILCNQLFGPVVLLNRPTGAVYHNFLLNNLPVPLEHVPLHQWQHMWFMHDGAPPHFVLIIRQHLNQTFREQWVGLGEKGTWPAWSPYLFPLDFWVWGYVKTSVH
jgi:hypothetical protein